MLCFMFCGTIKLFQQQLYHLIFPSAMHRHSNFFTFPSTCLIFHLFQLLILEISQEIRVITYTVFNFLMANFVELIFMHLLVFVCILWRNNYSNYLPIFQVTCPLSLSCSLYILLIESLSGIRFVLLSPIL